MVATMVIVVVVANDEMMMIHITDKEVVLILDFGQQSFVEYRMLDGHRTTFRRYRRHTLCLFLITIDIINAS